MTAAQRLLTLDEIVDAWVSGARFTFIAMIILVLAWSMSEISRELHTADFLIASLGDTLPAAALPAVIFVLAAFTLSQPAAAGAPWVFCCRWYSHCVGRSWVWKVSPQGGLLHSLFLRVRRAGRRSLG